MYTNAPSGASTQLKNFSTAVGVHVRPDDNCQCGEGVAVISAGRPPHAAGLVCITCHGHRGWLPHRAHAFILETIKQFGRPNEPIAYRRGLSSPEGHSMKNFDNRGSLFKNNKKAETEPDFSGTLNIDGTEYRLSGWAKVAKTGNKYLSLSVRPKAERPKVAAPLDDKIGF
jgi:hypothetical protein